MKLEQVLKLNKPFDNEQLKAVVNVLYTAQRVSDHIAIQLKPYKINEQHYNILRILKGRYPSSATPKEIKAVLINKKGDLTRLLDKLEKMNWIFRSTNPNCRRSVDVYITAEGLKNLGLLMDLNIGGEDYSLNLTSSEALELNRLLDKFRG